MKIKTLNQETISKISAGEVIIRPASVVKELVENSIDAGAKRISVSVSEGGKREILVRDDGCGISYDEVPLAFKCHTTSKISRLSDLDELSTMGFRGEALSSIIACADVLITTRDQEEELGSQSEFKNGYLKNQKVYPYEKGTEVIVSDLFEDVPARHKFLKKDETEERKIRDIMEKLAISHPDISFSYSTENRKIFQTSGSGNLEDVARNVFGQSFSKHLHRFHEENLPMKIYGLLGDLDARRTYRANQIFFLNGRYVKEKMLSQAFEDEWAGKLMQHQYPSGIIFVELPQHMLDVNVHPQKEEVRILNQSLVSILFKQCIKNAIENLNLIPENIPQEETVVEPVQIEEKTIPEFTEIKYSFSDNAPRITEIIEKPNPTVKPPKTTVDTVKPVDFVSYREIEEETLDLEALKIIGQVFNTYILAVDEETLYIIDQHAAHEAILYEAFSSAFKQNSGFESQGLLIPVTLAVSKDEIEAFNEVEEKLKSFGFEAEVVDEALQVNAVPMIADILQPPELIIELINFFSGKSAYRPDMGLSKIVSISCKAAIKAGNDLDTTEIKTLLSKLSKLKNPYTCPHGRPVIRKWSEYELEKLFKRIV